MTVAFGQLSALAAWQRSRRGVAINHRNPPAQTIRLTAEQTRLIREAAHKRYGPEARVWLFGSRVNDNAIGGDIDLLVEAGLFGP